MKKELLSLVSQRLKSPAKLNLFLKVLYRRGDGYHQLSSLFCAVSLCDVIDIDLSDEDEIIVEGCELPQGRGNLVCQALELFRQTTGLNFCVRIKLDKKIPLQSGLGGGSSNAATVLYGLNQMFNQPISQANLAALGAALSSDVPFFFSSGAALCEGRGENVFPVDLPPMPAFYIAKPSFGCSTPQVFGKMDCSLLEEVDIPRVLENYRHGRPVFFNDLEKAAFAVVPALKEFRDSLYSLGFEKVSLSGSGSAFFCFGSPLQKNCGNFFLQKARLISRRPNSWY